MTLLFISIIHTHLDARLLLVANFRWMLMLINNENSSLSEIVYSYNAQFSLRYNCQFKEDVVGATVEFDCVILGVYYLV